MIEETLPERFDRSFDPVAQPIERAGAITGGLLRPAFEPGGFPPFPGLNEPAPVQEEPEKPELGIALRLDDAAEIELEHQRTVDLAILAEQSKHETVGHHAPEMIAGVEIALHQRLRAPFFAATGASGALVDPLPERNDLERRRIDSFPGAVGDQEIAAIDRFGRRNEPEFAKTEFAQDRLHPGAGFAGPGLIVFLDQLPGPLERRPMGLDRLPGLVDRPVGSLRWIEMVVGGRQPLEAAIECLDSSQQFWWEQPTFCPDRAELPL